MNVRCSQTSQCSTLIYFRFIFPASSRRSMIIPGGRLSRSISPRGVLPILPGVLQNSSRLHLRLDSENTGGAFLNPTMLQPPPYEAVTHPTACELPPYDDPSHSHTPDVQVDPKEVYPCKIESGKTMFYRKGEYSSQTGQKQSSV